MPLTIKTGIAAGASRLRYREASRARSVKTPVASPASSIDWQQVDPAIRERALFSARVVNGEFLQQFDDQVRAILQGDSTVTESRLALKQYLDGISYQPAPEDAGTIKDLSSDARINLILQTNVPAAQGYGWYAQGQDADVLDQWPAQELFRAESRHQERDWLQRWRGAGGKLYGGRMIAKKNDPIWTELGPFHVPYPPFDFNSGMDVRDIDRDEAVALGVIGKDEIIQPADTTFGGAIDLPVGIRDAQLRAAVTVPQVAG